MAIYNGDSGIFSLFYLLAFCVKSFILKRIKSHVLSLYGTYLSVPTQVYACLAGIHSAVTHYYNSSLENCGISFTSFFQAMVIKALSSPGWEALGM